jgi:DNA-binding CsgD family transcriptional regulator
MIRGPWTLYEATRPLPTGWPLIGRDDVLRTVTAALARRGPGSLVLSGRPGVGRSRLAREALDAARTAGFATEWFVATRDAASIPFGAFARLLAGLDLESSDRLTLFGSAAEVLAERAGGRRLVLVVDDAHLLDQAGAAFLHQVGATGAAFVVATVCTGEPAPEPIVALGRDGLGGRIEVPALTAADFDRLLGAVLDGLVDGGTLNNLVDSTRGSLSFLHELVAAGLESGALVKADGIWRWNGPLGSHPRLLAVMESRLECLTSDERLLLDLLAAAEPVELGLLERLVPAGALESVERKGLLDVMQDNQRISVRLALPLYGAAIRATTPPLRVRLLRRRLALALRDTGCRRHGDLPRETAWRLDGGEAVHERELLAAAREAAARSDHHLVERLSRAALARGNGFKAHRFLSQALIGQGRLEEAGTLLRDSANAAEADAELGVLSAMRALVDDRPHEAHRVADAILQSSGADDPARLGARVVAAMALAVARRFAGNLAEAETSAAAGYRRTVREGNDAARSWWALLLGRVALDRGRVRTASRWFREATALSRTGSSLGQLPRCLACLSIAAGQAGRADTAAAALAEAEEVARPLNTLFEPDLLLARSWTAAVHGEISRAVKLALEAGDIAWERGQLHFAASAFHDAVRLGAVDDAVGRLTDVVTAVSGEWGSTILAHAVALKAHDGPALDGVSTTFERTGAVLLAAESATEAAAAHRRTGRMTSALVASDRARALHRQCEEASTPALSHLEGDVLTRREREVAALAARGLSNREVADLLFVSVRTIENQLHRVYGKLGVARREELAAALGQGSKEAKVVRGAFEWRAARDISPALAEAGLGKGDRR